jgi:hypothetical protein
MNKMLKPMIFFGTLLYPIYTLALERKNMKEACPLKVREYLSYGYPIVIGYEDTAFLGKDVDFILKLKGDKSNESSVELMRHFIEKTKAYIVSSDSIRSIDVRELEEERLSFIEKIIVDKDK